MTDFDPRSGPSRPDPAPETPLVITAGDRVMVIAPHPDDEVLAAGGLIQYAIAMGAGVRVVYLTDGENNGWAQLAVEGRWPFTPRDRARWGSRRREEALAGLECLCLSAGAARFLGFPDGGLSNLYMSGDSRLTLALIAELDEWRPTLIVASAASDPHPDHSAAAFYLDEAQERRTQPVTPRRLYYANTLKPQREPRSGRTVLLPAQAQDRKRRAILCHRSQLRWHRDAFLAFVGSRETFAVSKTVGVEDPAQPVAEAVVDGDRLRVRLREGAGWRGAVLWIALEAQGLEPVRLVVRMPRLRGGARIWDERRREIVGRATPRRTPGGRVLDLPLPLRRPRGGFVKLDRPLARRLGFIYGAGWRPITLAAEATATGVRVLPAEPALRTTSVGR
jgi:LmbE family N-acetylglucosaminyl deacetylase